MKSLPTSGRLAALIALALLLSSAAIVFFEALLRVYSMKPSEFSDLTTVLSMLGILLLAGLTFAWRDLIEFPEGEEAIGRSRALIAHSVAAVVCLAIALFALFSTDFKSAISNEMISLISAAAVPLGFGLAAFFSLLRALREFRR